MLNQSKKYLNTDLWDFSLQDTKKLQNLIKHHSNLYYNKEEPIISDYEYDELFNKLTILENKYNLESKQSDLVWADIWESTFEKVRHSRPMISLGNTYNEEDLNDFNDRVIKLITSSQPSPLKKKEQEKLNYPLPQERGVRAEVSYILEFKFDWLGLELIYKNWKLTQAITRWNWVEGEDVTLNAMQIANIPKTIAYKKHLEVRGEVVMPISVFNDINEKAKKEGTKIFSNPRNSASWSLRMKDASVTKHRKLQFFAYDLANFDEFRTSPPTPLLIGEGSIDEYYYIIKHIEKLWFDISSYFVKLNWIKEVIDSIKNFWDIKKTIDFEIDWLVLKVNDISLWKIIWFTEHHPRYAISYKFPAEVFTTKILSIDYQVGRTGTITPVANLEPVNMWWAIIKRATLHNFEEVDKLWVKIWDTVFIKRAWEVIPKIISVSVSWYWDKITVPEKCPSCLTEIIKDDNKVRYYCPNNIDCPSKNHEKLTFAVGKWWFNIDWFWEKQVELFLKEGIIHNIVDIFKISEKSEEILELEWFQEKSVNNLITWIEKAKNADIATFFNCFMNILSMKKDSKNFICIILL